MKWLRWIKRWLRTFRPRKCEYCHMDLDSHGVREITDCDISLAIEKAIKSRYGPVV